MYLLLKRWYHPQPITKNDTGRDPYIDNLRFGLIILVVMGHFLSQLTRIKELKYLYYIIHIFHMPCFIFVSGYLSKHVHKNGRFNTYKIMSLFWMFLLFKISNYICTGMKGKLNLFNVKDAPWYLLALVFWTMAIPFLEKSNKKFVLITTILLALICGYDSSIGSFMVLSRTIVFLPFFILGFYTTKEQLDKLLNLRLRIPAILLFISSFLVLTVIYPYVKPFVKIVFAGSSYISIFKKYWHYGAFIRFIWYALAFVFSISFLLLVPRIKLSFTVLGERTLPVYILHILLRNRFMAHGFFAWLLGMPKLIILLIIPFCVLLTILLANPYFNRITQFIMKHPFFLGFSLKRAKPIGVSPKKNYNVTVANKF
ncbi:acyltransferase family protein [Lachnoclostridium sp.]|uniref:acyltransferase family protein n=1 Tax=Lachnoclostridium sp. TaxID=2028282 RepID=UPI0028971755|nr:acyltransferase family protein [Lachnoclostridium sp.]